MIDEQLEFFPACKVGTASNSANGAPEASPVRKHWVANQANRKRRRRDRQTQIPDHK